MQAFTRVYVALCHQSIEDRKGLGQHLGQGPGPENSNAKLLLKGKLLQGATKKQILQSVNAIISQALSSFHQQQIYVVIIIIPVFLQGKTANPSCHSGMNLDQQEGGN